MPDKKLQKSSGLDKKLKNIINEGGFRYLQSAEGTTEILQLFIDSVVSISGAERAVVCLYDDAGNIGNLLQKNMPDIEEDKSFHYVFDLLRDVYDRQYPLSSFDNYFNENFKHLEHVSKDRGLLLLPITNNKGKCFGAFYIEIKDNVELEEKSLQMLSILADLLCSSLRQSVRREDELKMIFDNVNVGLVVCDNYFVIERANQVAADIFSSSEEKITGVTLFDAASDRLLDLKDAKQISLRKGKTPDCSFFIDDKNSRDKIYIDASISPLPDKLGELKFLITLNDITERQKILTDAAQREKMASIGTLAAGIAHEFNNIWSAVNGYAELAQSDDKFLGDLVDVTLVQAGRATDIIHSLLSFSDKRQEFRRGIKLNRTLKGVLQLVDMELRSRSIDINVEIIDNPDVVGNEGQLQQVFLNLVINASHAIGNLGKIDITLTEENDFAVVRVKDDGKGMSEMELAHIFDPFYTTKGALGGDESADGHGLGLTLTYNLVMAHKGKIEVSSEKGEGSIFTVAIPVADDEEYFDYVPEFDLEAAKHPERSLDILIVDDEILLQRLLSSMLNAHSVDSVSSGAAALALFAKKKYDLVFIDIVLEGEMDGFELFDKIREINENIPLVIITGRTEEKKLEQYIPRATDYVRKPFTMGDIFKSVNNGLKNG